MKKNLKQRIYVSIRNNKKCLFSTNTIHPSILIFLTQEKKKRYRGFRLLPWSRESKLCVCVSGRDGRVKTSRGSGPPAGARQTNIFQIETYRAPRMGTCRPHVR